MGAIAFDTLAYSAKLQQAGVPRAQADAIATANDETIKSMLDANELATKKDLALALAETKNDILKWMVTAMITQTALLVAIIAFLK